MLNDVFTVFDALVERHGLEKVKTIGDAYMVVGGLTERSDDHTASAWPRWRSSWPPPSGGSRRGPARHRLPDRHQLRPGRGRRHRHAKFIYDVWGDTVNLASRMESLGVPGRVQVTHAVMERLAAPSSFEPRGLIEVKGKGPTPTWFLVPPTAWGGTQGVGARGH